MIQIGKQSDAPCPRSRWAGEGSCNVPRQKAWLREEVRSPRGSLLHGDLLARATGTESNPDVGTSVLSVLLSKSVRRTCPDLGSSPFFSKFKRPLPWSWTLSPWRSLLESVSSAGGASLLCLSSFSLVLILLGRTQNSLPTMASFWSHQL